MRKRYHKRGKSGGERHVRLPHFMLNSLAWRSLSPVARCVYVEASAFYRGDNNGWIALPIRLLSERIGVAKDTISRAISELDDRGFIQATYIGRFTRKDRRASEYRLTLHACDKDLGRSATRDFMSWMPLENHGPSHRTVQSDHKDTRNKIITDSPTTRTVSAEIVPLTVRLQGHR